MKRSLISALASLLLTVDALAAEPRWTVEFKEGAYSFETATGLEVTQKTVDGKTFPGYLLLKLPPDVDPATTSRGILLGRVRVPEGRVTWLKGTDYAIGEMLPAHHRIVITPNAGFEPGLWAVTVKDSVKDKSARAVNPTNAIWTVDIGMPPGRAPKGEEGPARNPMKLMFTKDVDPTTYADGIVVEKQLAGGGWKEEPRGTAALPPKEHGGARNEVALLPIGGWERGATYRVRITDEIRDFGGMPLTNAEDFVITVPKTGPLQTRQAAKRPVAAPTQAASAAGPLFPGGQPLGWHGHWTDPITGLIYTQNRWYDPRSGTFLSRDPMEDLDSPNLFLYGGGRPHEVVDPLGLCVSWGCQQQFRFAYQDPTLSEEAQRVQAAATQANAAISAAAKRTVQTTVVVTGATVAIAAAPVAPLVIGGTLLLGGQSLHERYDIRRTGQLAEGRGGRYEALGLAMSDVVGTTDIAEGSLGFRVATGESMSSEETGAAWGNGTFSIGTTLAGATAAPRIVLGAAEFGPRISSVLEDAGIQTPSSRWEPGMSIVRKTTQGNSPAFSTVQKRFWKNQGLQKAPTRLNPSTGSRESMELSHRFIPQRLTLFPPAIRNSPFNLEPLWPQEHAAVDWYRWRTLDPNLKPLVPEPSKPLF